MPVLCGNRHAHSTPTYHDNIANVKLCFASPTSIGSPAHKGWLRDAQINLAGVGRGQRVKVDNDRRPSNNLVGAYGQSDDAKKALAERGEFLRRRAALINIGLYEGIDADTVRCGRCAGTGEFITGSVNGKPVGPGGICFRCLGRGHQTDCGTAAHYLRAEKLVDTPDTADWSGCCDRVRNDLYDRFGIRFND